MMQAASCSSSYCPKPEWGRDDKSPQQLYILDVASICAVTSRSLKKQDPSKAAHKTHPFQTLGVIISASFTFQQQHR